jgi:hypothetical protein
MALSHLRPHAEAERCRQQNDAARQAIADLEQARQQFRRAQERVRRVLLACGYVAEGRKKKGTHD